MRDRRRVLAWLAAASISLCSGVWSLPGAAQSYPARPLKLIVPFPAGGSADLVGRIVARKMSEGLGQQIIVENRAGAGGTIGVEAASKAPGDGYTMGLGTVSTLAMAPSLYPRLGYDPVRSFAPISLVSSAPFVLAVNPALPATSLKELIHLARSKPGQLNFASIGNGTLLHFAGESFKTLAGVNIVHVPYKGAAPALVDLIAGQVHIMMDQLASFQLQNLQSGKLRPLVVAGAKRLAQLPAVPTAAEAGLPGFEVSAWFGLVAPRGTPPEAVKRLNAEALKALMTREAHEAMFTQGIEPVATSPEQFAALINEEIAKWARVVRESGFRMD